MKALIIVDVQNDFMPGGTLAVPAGDLIVPVINKIQRDFALIIATQDWHPSNHVSFVSSHPGREPFDTINLRGTEQILWPAHCVQNTTGADFHPALETARIEAIIRKGMDPEIDSYSGFFDNDRQKRTGLAGYLKEKNATELYFCGLAADICVYFTIMDALQEGFSVALIEDATRPIDDNSFAAQKEELSAKGVNVCHSW